LRPPPKSPFEGCTRGFTFPGPGTSPKPSGPRHPRPQPRSFGKTPFGNCGRNKNFLEKRAPKLRPKFFEKVPPPSPARQPSRAPKAPPPPAPADQKKKPSPEKLKNSPRAHTKTTPKILFFFFFFYHTTPARRGPPPGPKKLSPSPRIIPRKQSGPQIPFGREKPFWVFFPFFVVTEKQARKTPFSGDPVPPKGAGPPPPPREIPRTPPGQSQKPPPKRKLMPPG